MSARILALDTTSEFGSVALAEGGETIEETLLHSPDGFGHLLFDAIARTLRRHSWAADSIDCFAAAAGPGSFTGVRIGLSAVKGLGEALSKPAAAVSNLQAMALFSEAPLRATLLDARRGEIYGAVYDASLAAVVEERVLKFRDWLTILPREEFEFAAHDPALFRPALAGTRFEQHPWRQAPRALAAAVARIAGWKLERGEVTGTAALDANYVRRPDAELFWKDKR